MLTLATALPKRAKLKISTFNELEIDDLIFFLIDQEIDSESFKIPFEYIFQTRLAIFNTGNQKVIISKIQINGFINEANEVISLPSAPLILEGLRYDQHSGYVNGELHFQILHQIPPYFLSGGDSLVIRFRTIRGIHWAPELNFEEIAGFEAKLRNQIVKATGKVIWRQGPKIKESKFTIGLNVVQQSEYFTAIGKTKARWHSKEVFCGPRPRTE